MQKTTMVETEAYTKSIDSLSTVGMNLVAICPPIPVVWPVAWPCRMTKLYSRLPKLVYPITHNKNTSGAGASKDN